MPGICSIIKWLTLPTVSEVHFSEVVKGNLDGLLSLEYSFCYLGSHHSCTNVSPLNKLIAGTTAQSHTTKGRAGKAKPFLNLAFYNISSFS